MMIDLRIERISVIGNAAIETKIFLDAIPTRNCETNIKKMCISIGGSGAYVAGALRVLGLEVNIITQLGNDSYGKHVLSALRRTAVDLGYVLLSSSLTSSFISIFDKDFNRIFLLRSVKWNEKITLQRLVNALQHSDLLMLCPTTRSITMEAAKLCKTSAKLLAISPEAAFIGQPQKWIDKLFKFADFLFLNESELCHYTNSPNLKKALERMAIENDQIVVVTRGRKGCMVISREGIISEKGEAGEVIDPTGAGSLFLASFIWSLANNHNLREASRIGCLGGYAACTSEKFTEKLVALKKTLIRL